MAEVKPFAGVRYRLQRPEDAASVVAPPYDVIAPEEQQALLARSPHNVVRLELPRDEPGDGEKRNRYTRAAELFQEWLTSGVLAREAEARRFDSMYLPEHTHIPVSRKTPPPTGDFTIYVGMVSLYAVLYTTIALLVGLILFEDRDLA